MKLPNCKRIKWNYPLLAFLFPCLGLLLMQLLCGYQPFGSNRSMLYSDMYHQYYPFFVNFRRALLAGESLQWNWSVGLGLDYLGLISYYLGSPLNWLTVLLPESWMLGYFSMLVPLKLGFASLFFSLFLKGVFQKNDLSITVFGCFYGLCAWALGYQWNVMWLDGFALLPLIMLGMVQMLRNRKVLLYTLSLALAVSINYYVGFFLCIFVLITFFCYAICRFPGIKRIALDFLRIAVCSALAIGMTAFMTLPAYSALQTAYSTKDGNLDTLNLFSGEAKTEDASSTAVTVATNGFSVNILDKDAPEVKEAQQAWKAYEEAKETGAKGFALTKLWLKAQKASFGPILGGMKKIAGNLGGGIEPTFVSEKEMPNIACGVLTVVLAFLFLLSPRIKLRDKLCSSVLVIFLMLSFILRKLDYIWHGFHFPNQIPYRFSFLVSFVLLYMAYRAFLVRRSFRVWQILVAGILTLLIFSGSTQSKDTIFIVYNLVFLLLYMALLLIPKIRAALPKEPTAQQRAEQLVAAVQRKKICAFTLAAVMAVELVMTIVNFATAFPYTTVTDYPRGKTNLSDALVYLQKDPEPFYRTEVTHSQTLNDGALIGYNGISTFTSSANYKVSEFMQALGFSARNNYNRYCYEEASPVANLFLGIKYMIHRENGYSVRDDDGTFLIRYNQDFTAGRNSLFKEVSRSGKVSLLENQAYLPLGFMTDQKLAEFNFSTAINCFQLQNKLLQAATGIEEDVWNRNGTTLQVTAHNTAISSWDASGYCAYQSGVSYLNGIAQSYKVIYTYTALDSGLFCVRLSLPKSNSFSFAITKQGQAEPIGLFSESYNSLPEMMSVCDVAPGDQVHIIFNCPANETGTINISSAILDRAVFDRAYGILRESTLQIHRATSTHIEGSVSCEKNGLLYTSIPQNGNWKAYVDGQEASTVLVGDAMLALPLTAGDHSIVFVYSNPSFVFGGRISLICVLLFAGLCCLYYKPWRLFKIARKTEN